MSKSEIKAVVITLVGMAIFLTFAFACAYSVRGDEFVCINQDLAICK